MLATIGNLANVTWALGDLDAAAASFREQVALLRNSPVEDPALARICSDESRRRAYRDAASSTQALVAAREGLPLVKEDGSAWIFSDHIALRAALAGKLSDCRTSRRLLADTRGRQTRRRASPIEARAA